MKIGESIPEGKIMLHSCCAPCSGAILEWMKVNGVQPVVFFSNSNITPKEEYDKRLQELKRYCDGLGIELIDDEYDHEAWLDFALDRKAGRPERTRELAAAPERAERCARCFQFRLERAVRKAKECGCTVLTTSLASSRWKSLAQVDKAGEEACAELEETAGEVNWWAKNWRKGGLQPRRSEIIKEQAFYNQNWCGCEFSEHTEEGK